MDLTPAQKARRVGFVAVGAIILVLAIFLLITWLTGDTTNNLRDRQPSPSPAAQASAG